jgi:hypothetical protein
VPDDADEAAAAVSSAVQAYRPELEVVPVDPDEEPPE